MSFRLVGIPELLAVELCQTTTCEVPVGLGASVLCKLFPFRCKCRICQASTYGACPCVSGYLGLVGVIWATIGALILNTRREDGYISNVHG